MQSTTPTCRSDEHSSQHLPMPDRAGCERAAAIFRALGDTTRLQMLALLAQRELCVTEIAACMNDNLSAVSQRLKLLRSERIVAQRRAGKHVYYSLADHHVAELIANALAHANELDGDGRRRP